MSGNYDIRSRPSGPHWIAWLARPGEDKPAGAVILVGETQQEAESNARRWAEQVVSGTVVPFR